MSFKGPPLRRRKSQKPPTSFAQPVQVTPAKAKDCFLEDCDQSQNPEEPSCETKVTEVSSDEAESLASASEGSEEEYRGHTAHMITEYGLEFTKAIFNLEVMKCKKPKTENKKK